MKDFRKQVAEIKFWTYFAIAGVAVLLVSYGLPVVIIILEEGFGIQVSLPQFMLDFIMNMFLSGWAIGYGLIFLAGSSIGKRKTCPRCGTNLKIKELEAMGDSFFCPYCLNRNMDEGPMDITF